MGSQFLHVKGLDVPVIWTLGDDGLHYFEILGTAHPVTWCCISVACVPEMQIV